MEALKKTAFKLLVDQNFDSLAVGVIDFSKKSFESFEMKKYPEFVEESLTPHMYFDLASVTKPLTLALSYFLHQDKFDDEMKLLLNHQAGLPDWGLLSKKNWKDEVSCYPIKKSPTLYSDYSALRLMLEFESRTKKNMQKECAKIWDAECVFWKDLPENAICPPTGFRAGRPIIGAVHDPNAYNIGEFCSHAGLFATVAGLCRTLLNFNQELDLIKEMKKAMQQRDSASTFVNGWDTTTISDHQRIKKNESSLAGKGCSDLTFGFLGFTGTSVWIDPEMNRGQVILTNGTKNYWYSRTGLNALRRKLGEEIWSL
ncbi:MAG: serine hydrolase [Bacteriovoracaceae bacterium]|nr:serine hydrolase [Bacteriovoracaceae bacterium]